MSISRRELLKVAAGRAVADFASLASPNAVAEVQKSANSVNRFPNSSDVLGSSLASVHGVRSDQILLGAGSTAIMKMAVDLFSAMVASIQLSN
jgi:histidinol-phosphate/aromatic aminotransferase/cobyric acid decarboxylase-like protein